MHLKNIKRFSQEQLFEKLRQITLLDQKDKLPYANADFEIRFVNPQDFQPSTFYILRQRLNLLISLMDKLNRKQAELEKLDTLLEYQDEFDFCYRMIPPVVELTDFGQWMILDGEHRSFIAIQRHTKISMLFIKNVSYFYPCLPLPEGWKSVRIVDRVPSLKRLYRKGLNDTPETRYSLHRNLEYFGSQRTRKPFSVI